MKKSIFQNLNKIFFIGGAIFLSKIIFLFIPYLINDIQYNAFNKIYYSAAIVILFGKLGFEFAINRIDISHRKLFFAVFLNTIITTFTVVLLSKENISLTNSSAIFIYSFFYILANIFLIKNLFEGGYKKYFIYKLFYGIVLITSVLVLLKFNSEVFLVFPIVGILWFIFVYSFNWRSYHKDGNLKDFYKLGISGFVINAVLGFAFIADKYIVNHFFELDVANAYTFAWALTSPMLYLGTMISHSIFASNSESKRKTVILSTLLLFVLVFIYGVFIYLLVSFYPDILPASINYDLIKSILGLFLIVYPIFTIVQFPLDGILFKYIKSESQFKLAKVYPIIFLVYLTILFTFFANNISNSYFLLIAINTSYLFFVIGIKTIVIKSSVAKFGH